MTDIQIETPAITEVEKNPDIIEESNLYSYVVIGIIAVIIMLIIYLAYSQFISNSDGADAEGFVKGQEQERTDLVIDYNLQQVIDHLNKLQNTIVKKLSSDTGL